MTKIDLISSGINGSSASVTISHLVANLADRFMLVAVHVEDASATDRIVSGVTYNGVAMTFLDSLEASNARIELWYLLAPDTGTHDVVVTMGGTCTNLSAGVIGLYNAMQQAPEIKNKNSGATDSVSAAITTISGEAFMLSVGTGNGGTPSFTHGAGQTERYQTAMGSSVGVASTEIATVGGSNTQSESQVGTSKAIIVAAIAGKHEINVNDTLGAITESVTVARGSALSVNDVVGIVENVSLVLPFLLADVFDALLISEYSEATIGVAVDTNDTVTTSEDVALGLNPMKVNVGENSAITEAASAQPDALFVDVFEPFGITITEHADVIDLITEVGIVIETINPTDEASAYLDVLNINVNDLASAEDFSAVYLDALNIDSNNVYDSVIVLDLQLLNTDFLYSSEDDDVLVVSVASLFLDELFIEISENIVVAEYEDAYLDVLNVDVNDALAVTDFNETVIPELVTENYDDVAIAEFANQGRELLEADVNDLVAVTDNLDIVFQILLPDVYDDILATEDAFLQPDHLFLFADDPFGVDVADIAQILDAIRFVGPVSDFINVSEAVSLYPLTLHPFGPDKPTGLVGQYHVDEFIALYMPIDAGVVSDLATVLEDAQASVRIALSVFDAVTVTDARELVRDPEIKVVEATIAVTMSAQARPDNLFVGINDMVGILESRVVSTDPLYLEAFDVASVVEFLKMTDIVVELGPVWEDIGPVTELQVIIQIFAPLLNINVHDNITWVGGLIAAGLDPFDLAVSDAVTIAENFGGLDEAMDVFAFDSVTVSEFKNIPSPFHYDDIIFDVFDNVSVAEDQTTFMPILRPGVFDAIVVSEDFDGDTGNNNLSRFDSVNIQEQVTIDREILINVYDAVAVVERLVARDSLYQDTPILFQFKTRVRIFTSDQINTTGVLIP